MDNKDNTAELAVENNTYTREPNLITVPIENTDLAKVLELECAAKGEILTFPEYASVVIPIAYGFQGLSNDERTSFRGKTDIHTRWSTALAQYCIDKNYQQLLEFGCGDGSLVENTLSILSSKKYKIKYTGIESILPLRQQTETRLKKAGFEADVNQITTLDNLKVDTTSPVLVVFPFSLDSVTPSILTTSKIYGGMPDTEIGITVKNGYLIEQLILPNQLKFKNRGLENGIYTVGDKWELDLSSWDVSHQWDRVYFPSGMIETLATLSQLVPLNSEFIIIDEKAFNPTGRSRVILPPRTINTFIGTSIDCDLVDLYQQSGNTVFYHPLCNELLHQNLFDIGFSKVSYNGEISAANNLTFHHSEKNINETCLATFAQNLIKNQKLRRISIQPPKIDSIIID